MRGLRHVDGGFRGGGAAGGRWSLCALRLALRASIHAAASVSFSETSRKNCAARFSVSGAASSFTKLFTRASSSSTRFPKSLKFLMLFIRANSSSMRLPNSSNLSMPVWSPEKSPCREELRRLGYYRNAVCGSQGGELAFPDRWQWRVEKWKNAMRGFFGGGDHQPRPKLCPACGALVGISAMRCHECGASLRFSLAALSKKLSGLFGEHEAPVTSALLVTNILMFGVSLVLTMQAGEAGGLRTLWGMSGAASYQLGMSIPFPFLLQEHQWWRLVTAMFLHGGLIHIGLNMMNLMQFGPALEELYGSARYLFLYVVTGALGFVASALTGHFSIGASGALLGLIGAMLAVTSKRGGSFMRELRSRLITSVAILFMIGFWGGLGIDNSAHIGGFAVGFVLGKIYEDRQPMNAAERKRAQLLGWFAGIVIIASFVLMILHFHDPLPGR